LKRPHEAQWEAIAQQAPYFRILSNDGLLHVESSNVSTDEFWESGEEDVAAILLVAASILGHGVSLVSCLDFGCGVGRLTLPLARRAGNVVACDIAPTMLAHARHHADAAGLRNVAFVATDDLITLRDGEFSFVCSLLVLQYIPHSFGYGIIRNVLRLLAPDGVAMLQILLAPPHEAMRQLVRMSRASSRRGSKSPQRRKEPDSHGMQTYRYDADVVKRDVEAAGARLLASLPTRHGDTTSSVLVIQKSSALP
jgi:2-polyprenyl-3-methyl-5-hydroxy-6-metoxy-1,4-benzoquinol methylase